MRALVVSTPLMELVRSTTRATSTRATGSDPQGPLQAAEVTTWVSPSLTPTAPPKRNGTLTEPVMTSVLQVSPSAGSQGAVQMPCPQRQAEGATTPGLHVIGMSDRSGRLSWFRSPMRQRKLWLTRPGGIAPG